MTLQSPHHRDELISVIIPVYNASATLADCLASVSHSQGACFDIIVADDGSTDSSAEIAARFPARLLRLVHRGAAAARNSAAQTANGAILFFLDADICVEPDSLARIAAALRARPELSALFGSYRRDTVPSNFFSDYKNLEHHHTHQISSPDAITFCSGFGAVRREAFLNVGGFNESVRTLEDIDFGYRLHQAGHRIRLDKDLQFTHLKRYTLKSLVASDFFNRAIPWTRLMLERRVFRNDLNTRSNNIASMVIAFLLLAAPLWVWWNPFGPGIAILCAASFLVLNWDFLGFAWRARGPVFFLQTVVMHWFYYIYSGIGFVIGVWSFWRNPRPRR